MFWLGWIEFNLFICQPIFKNFLFCSFISYAYVRVGYILHEIWNIELQNYNICQIYCQIFCFLFLVTFFINDIIVHSKHKKSTILRRQNIHDLLLTVDSLSFKTANQSIFQFPQPFVAVGVMQSNTLKQKCWKWVLTYKSWFSDFPMQNQTIDALFKSGKRRNHSQRLQISKEPHSDLYHPHLNSFSIWDIGGIN